MWYMRKHNGKALRGLGANPPLPCTPGMGEANVNQIIQYQRGMALTPGARFLRVNIQAFGGTPDPYYPSAGYFSYDNRKWPLAPTGTVYKPTGIVYRVMSSPAPDASGKVAAVAIQKDYAELLPCRM